jgi:methyl-accepting chemotaxis protein
MTIKLRLFLFIATALATALVMSLSSYLGNTRTGSAMQENEISTIALRNHMEADMMHDALRADVLSAMLVGLGKNISTKAEVSTSLKEHAEHFRQALGDNLKLPLDDTLRPQP